MEKKRIKLITMIAIVLLLSTILLACGNDTSYDGTLNIIEAEEVAKVYLSDENTFLIDARGQEAYDKGHFENAICLPATDLVVNKPVPVTIAPKAKVERVLSNLGITSDSTIYIYDDNGGVSAGRVWWTLKLYGHEKVMVVNNGSKALLNSGLEPTLKNPEVVKSEYVAKDGNLDMIASYDYVKEITENPDSSVKIIDVRSIAEYDQGSIPRAILYPHTKNLYSDGSFMSARDLYLFYIDKDIKPEDELVLYCKSSFRATQTMALLQEAGYENIKVYDGAWIEWELAGGEMSTPEESALVTDQDGS